MNMLSYVAMLSCCMNMLLLVVLFITKLIK